MTSPLPYSKAQLTEDTHVAYIDSWGTKPAAELPERYTTLIALHGVGFNSAVWTPLLPHLPSSTRFLAYNQRSYTGSSPAFESKKEGGTDATAAYLGDLLNFIEFAVEELKVPAIDDATGKGGIALLGWSKGTVLPISLLSLLHASPLIGPTSFISSLPPDLSLSTLTSHLRSIILFEPPGSSLGRAPTIDYTSAMTSVSPPNSSTPTEFAEAFAGWIGSYSSSSFSKLSLDISSLPPSGLSSLSPSIRQVAWEPQAVAHGFSWRLSSSSSEATHLAKHALSPPLSPVIPIGLVYGERTNGYCLDAAETILGWWGVVKPSIGEEEEKKEKEGEEEKKEGGKVGVKVIEGTNHFAFVHEGKKFAEVVEELLSQLGQ